MKNINNETALIILIIVAIFLFSGFGMMGLDGGMMSGYNYGFMWFGWIFMLLILIALVLFIVWLIKQIQK